MCDFYGFKSEFESMIPDMEEYTYKMALSVLPRSQIIESGDEFLKQDYIAMGAALIKDGQQFMDIFHTTAATYRAGKEDLAALCRAQSQPNVTNDYINMDKVYDDLKPCLQTKNGEQAGGGEGSDPAVILSPRAVDLFIMSRMSFSSCVRVAALSNDQLTLLSRCANEVYLVDKLDHLVPDSVLETIKGVDFSRESDSFKNYCKLVNYRARVTSHTHLIAGFSEETAPDWMKRCK